MQKNLFSGAFFKRVPKRLRAKCLVFLLFLLTIFTPSTAFADTGIGLTGPSGLGFLTADSSWDLVNSGYDLGQIDPLSGALMGPDITSTMTSDFATSTDLAQNAQLAFDAADMARRARAEAEAKRLAALGAGNGRLRPGAVPSPYDAILEREIGRCPGLPLGVIAAQLGAESNWNPNARSPVGAQGIGQFMPGTWTSAGIDGNGDGRKNVLDPEDAIPAAIVYDCNLLSSVKSLGLSEDPLRLMLAAYNAGLGNVKKYGGVPPFAETQGYVAKIMSSSTSFTEAAASQTEVGADGCPTSAPPNTLRGGATSLGVGALCAQAVREARSPEAAKAIMYMLNHLGEPYSQPLRNSSGYADCSSYVSKAYRAAGVSGIYPPGANAQTTASFQAAQGRWTYSVPYAERRPGDLIFPSRGHVGMVLAGNWMVHTNRTGDVSHVRSIYSASGTYLVLRIDPSRI